MSNSVRYFQWISGNELGKIVKLIKYEEDDGLYFLVFDDNGNEERCNMDLIADKSEKNPIGKYMIELEDPNNPWTFKEEIVGGQEERWEKNEAGELVCVVPKLEGVKKIIPIPPKPNLAKFGFTESVNTESVNNNYCKTTLNESENITDTYNNESNTSASIEIIPEQPIQQNNSNNPIAETNPLEVLMSNAKKHLTTINMDIEITVPSKSLYNLIINEFDDKYSDLFFDYIINNININDIKNALKMGLKNAFSQSDI